LKVMSRILIIAVVVIIAVSLAAWGCYLRFVKGVGWADWTGFGESTDPVDGYHRAKTLWDWMELLVVPVVLAVGALLFNWVQKKNELAIVEKQAQVEREIAEDRAQETALQGYLDRMTGLLLDRELSEAHEKSKIWAVARVRTLTVLQGLDERRRGVLLSFLYEADLINRDRSIIPLARANLSRANLHAFHLEGANLSQAKLYGVDLSDAEMQGVDLHQASLSNAKLFGADLREANLISAKLDGADLRMSRLHRAAMIGADLSRANLALAELNEADLTGACLEEADLSWANLTGAILVDVDLTRAILEKAVMPDGTRYEGKNAMGSKRVTDEIIELERMRYYHDEDDEECLAIDILGLELDKGGVLWVWAYKPRPVAPALGYSYPSGGPADDCTPDNSLRVGLASDLMDERDSRADITRVWIPLRVPTDLSGVKYLLLRTAHLDIQGWGK